MDTKELEQQELEKWEYEERELEEWKYEEIESIEQKSVHQSEEQLEEERRQRRRQRIEEMKREKHKREVLNRFVVPAAAFVFGLLLVLGIGTAVRFNGNRENGEPENSAVMAAQSKYSIGHGLTARTVAFPAEPAGENQMPDFAGDSMDSSQQGQLSDFVQKSKDSMPRKLSEDYGDDFDMLEAMQTNAAVHIGTILTDALYPVFEAHATESTDGFGDEATSEYGIMIDVEKGEVLAQKGGWSRINPASMTKVLTVLVAAEHVTDLDDTFVMTIDITDYSFENDCSIAGFEVGEEITVRDLFYGTVLPSGADAALGLAYYVAGSHEAFVDMMNIKLERLGLSETTHFTNCVGLYDENHFSTPYDIAVILKEAANNEFCREVLSEHYYVTAPTEIHPEGLGISNWFLRRIEDSDTHGEVLCAKTGYVDESGNCAASLGVDHDGREYICVTAGSTSSWNCIYDHVALYQRYLPE